jgi:hypothetical protein
LCIIAFSLPMAVIRRSKSAIIIRILGLNLTVHKLHVCIRGGP